MIDAMTSTMIGAGILLMLWSFGRLLMESDIVYYLALGVMLLGMCYVVGEIAVALFPRKRS